jgi:hypothetical protein
LAAKDLPEPGVPRKRQFGLLSRGTFFDKEFFTAKTIIIIFYLVNDSIVV